MLSCLIARLYGVWKHKFKDFRVDISNVDISNVDISTEKIVC